MLRPRYSLLTLLVLTALVAGGVKLWYGPHHVVERDKYFEFEFTYFKSWDASRIINGPKIMRIYQPDNVTLAEVWFTFYRNGHELPWRYVLCDVNVVNQKYRGPPRLAFLRNQQMSTEEQQACKESIELEKQRFDAQGTMTTDLLQIAVKENVIQQIELE